MNIEREHRDDRELGGIEAEHGRIEILAGFVVSRRRRSGLGRARRHVDRLLRTA